MSKLNIVLAHLAIFVAGSVGIALYAFARLTSPASGLGGVIVMPAVILIYVVAFALLCSLSLIMWLLVALVRGRHARR